ncbi:MAG: hypothetical protein KC468_08680 [Myxococcales bacterium]|nr:hypothetical protein [Myxococcales bacterium]
MTSRSAIRVALGGLLALAPCTASAQEVLVQGDQRVQDPGERGDRKFHGEARLGARPGFIAEDPMFSIEPSVNFDLREIVPLEFRLGADIRLRMVDRAPEQGQVIRGTDWDEPGDFITILQALRYEDAFVFARHGQFSVDLRAGELGRVELGHGSLVQGYANSLDVDRRRTGIDFALRLDGLLLEQPAGVELGLFVADLTGQQPLGARLGGHWAGAGLGLTVVGDPLAPRLARPADPPDAFVVDAQNYLQRMGDRGVAAVGLDLSYRFTDRWRYWISPYLDLNALPGLGRGLHAGLDLEFALGRRRRVHLGFVGEFTYGSDDYDPAYFDVFYTMQRTQAQFVAYPDDLPASFGTLATPKYSFVDRRDLGGAGGYGAIRFAHDSGGFAETGYRYRPGPLGHTWETRVGVDVPEVQLALLHAHRGELGFNIIEPAGSLAAFELNVPVLRYLDVSATAGWLYATRRPIGGDATAGRVSSGFVGGAGLVLLGIAGRFPW